MNDKTLQNAISEMSEGEKRETILLAPSRRVPKTLDKLRRVAKRWQDMREAEGRTSHISERVMECAEEAYEAILKAEEELDAYLEKYPAEETNEA